MPETIDPVEFGKLVQSVETLTKTVDKLNTDVTKLNLALTGGKMFSIGLLLAAGGIGAGVTKAIERLFG